MEVREASLEDMEEIARLYRALFYDMSRLQPEFFREAEQDGKVLASLIGSEMSDVILAFQGEELCGFALVVEQETQPFDCLAPHRFAHLTDLVVEPGFRGNGVGKCLLDKTKLWARKRGLEYVELNVLANNYGAIRLYEREGFRDGMKTMRCPLRTFFMITRRVGFSVWNEGDLPLARKVWGDAEVTRYLCASGRFTGEEIERRLKLEMEREREYKIQYWPVFDIATGEFIGCCGLRPHGEGRDKKAVYEMGFHLCRRFWGQGYAAEAAQAVLQYAFVNLGADLVFAGHHPENGSSAGLLSRLGFRLEKPRYYEPTGLMHPSYFLEKTDYEAARAKREGEGPG